MSRSGKPLTPEELLSTPEGVKKFAEWAHGTGLFQQRFGVRSETWKEGGQWDKIDWKGAETV